MKLNKQIMKILMNAFLGILIVSSITACKKEKSLSFTGKKTAIVSTVIGKRISYTRGGYADGTLDEALIGRTYDLVSDASGNIYFADQENHAIRKISTDGMVSTFAGSPLRISGLEDGTGTAAKFNGPTGLDIDAAGNLYVADTDNSAIRKITPSGVVTTIAGNGTGDYVDGTGSNARFKYPNGIGVDAAGNLYVSDSGNNRIRKITAGGVVTTFAGDGTKDFADGEGVNAKFSGTRGVRVSPKGDIYVSDSGNGRIRKITPAGVVSTFAGSGDAGMANGRATVAEFNGPYGIDFDAEGNLYVADINSSLIRKISPEGDVSTLAGLFGVGAKAPLYQFGGAYVDGPSDVAQFWSPISVAVDPAGNIYVSDFRNRAIRKITFIYE